MVLHIHHVPTRVTLEREDGEPRWCFYCRRRVSFTFRVHTPTDRDSYYGPHGSITCEHGHSDGDCFPGNHREWD